MAAAGFFFAPTKEISDRVECFFCHQSFSQWQENDDPALEHVKLCPNCPWAKLCSKVAAEWAQSAGVDTLSGTEHDPYSRSNYEGRLGTFVNWPYEKKRGWKPKSTSLAQAGFHFVPQCHNDDTTECALCGVTLNGWEPRDDPVNEHRRRRPECLFFLSVPKEVKWAPNVSPKKIMRRKPSPVLEDLTSIDITAEAYGTPLAEVSAASQLEQSGKEVSRVEAPIEVLTESLVTEEIEAPEAVPKEAEAPETVSKEAEVPEGVEFPEVVLKEAEVSEEAEIPEAVPKVAEASKEADAPEVESQVEPEELRIEVEAEAELAAELQIDTEFVPQGIPEAIAQTEIEIEIQTEPETEAQTEPEVQAEPETEACPPAEAINSEVEAPAEQSMILDSEVAEIVNIHPVQIVESTEPQVSETLEQNHNQLPPPLEHIPQGPQLTAEYEPNNSMAVDRPHTQASGIPQFESSTFYENIDDTTLIRKDAPRFSFGISGIDPELHGIGSTTSDHASNLQFKPREIVDLSNTSHISAADFSMAAGEYSIDVEDSPETTMRLKRSSPVAEANETKRARKSLSSDSSEFATAPSLIEPAEISRASDTSVIKADRSTAKRSFLAAWMHSTPSALKNVLSPRRLFGQAKTILPSPLGGQAEAKPSPADCTFAGNNPEFSMIGTQLINDPEPVKQIEEVPELDTSNSSLETVDEILILPSLDSLLDNMGGLTSDTLFELAKKKNGASSRQWLEMVADQVVAVISDNTERLVAELEKQRELAIRAVLRA